LRGCGIVAHALVKVSVSIAKFRADPAVQVSSGRGNKDMGISGVCPTTAIPVPVPDMRRKCDALTECAPISVLQWRNRCILLRPIFAFCNEFHAQNAKEVLRVCPYAAIHTFRELARILRKASDINQPWYSP
jgi:hypothetical protein